MRKSLVSPYDKVTSSNTKLFTRMILVSVLTCSGESILFLVFKGYLILVDTCSEAINEDVLQDVL